MTDATDWAWWENACAGNRGELTRGDPKTGFYRDKQRAIAIWREEGKLFCHVSSGYQPRHDDEIDDLFGFCSMRPITHEVYIEFVENGRWPEDISKHIEAAKIEPIAVGIGHNSGRPHEEIMDEIETLDRAFASWLKEIGGKIASEEHDAKAETFKTRFGDLEKRADAARVAEKAPHLAKTKEIDAAWQPAVKRADAGKRGVGAALTPYRQERERLRQDAERKAREDAARIAAEHARAAAEAAAANAPAPPAPDVQPPQQRTPVKTGLRTFKVLHLSDIKAASATIAALDTPPADFVDAVRTVARRMIESGVAVPGAEIREERRA